MFIFTYACFCICFFFGGGGEYQNSKFQYFMGFQYTIYVVGLLGYKAFCGYPFFWVGGGVSLLNYIFRVNSKSKKDSKDQEPIQSSHIPVLGYHIEK